MSFGSDPGRDDGGLPPANIVVPDDARELDRDLLAYRREQRARRRRERLLRLIGPLRRHGLGGHSTILPMIATCVALSLLAGAMLSVVTVSPASAPTVSSPAPVPTGLTGLPSGMFTVRGTSEPVRTLRSAVLALVPPDCACDQGLRQLAREAGTARADLYFVGEGGAIPRIPALTAHDGGGVAVAASDPGNVLGTAYRPAGLTVLLVYADGTGRALRGMPAVSRLTPAALRALTRPGR